MTEARVQLIEIITSPLDTRTVKNMEGIIQWIRQHIPTLRSVDKSGLRQIINNCRSQRVSKDDVIIQQGAHTDCMFIVLLGSALVYMDTAVMGEEDSWLSTTAGPTLSSRDYAVTVGKTRRSKLPEKANTGKYIKRYNAGESFGEVALLSEDAIMNATVVAEEDCDLMVINQDLFNTFLKSEQHMEYDKLCHFIDSQEYFTSLVPKLKKLLELYLRKEWFPYDGTIIRQGQAVTSLHFLLEGQANMYIESGAYQKQYPKLWPFEAGTDLYSQEFEYLRKSRRKAILRKYDDPAALHIKSNHLIVRRNKGYAAAEKMVKERSVCLCTVHRGEVLGDLEVVQNLGTYMSTVTCTAPTTAYVLDIRNLERLMGRRNQVVAEVMKEKAKEKLQRRANSSLGRDITFLNYLLFKITEDSFIMPENKTLPTIKTSKFLPGKDIQIQHLLEKFKDGQAQLIVPRVPGALIYKEQMQEKARIRASYRHRGLYEVSARLREVRQKIATREPRSRREIVKFLKESIESKLAEYTRSYKEAAKLKQSRKHKKNKTIMAATVHEQRELWEDRSKNVHFRNNSINLLNNIEDTKQTSELGSIIKSEEEIGREAARRSSKSDTDNSHCADTKNWSLSHTVTAVEECIDASSLSSQVVTDKVTNQGESKYNCVKVIPSIDKQENLNSVTCNLEYQKIEVPASSNSLTRFPPLAKSSLRQSERTSLTKWESAMKLVNARITDLASCQLLSHRPGYEDYETSDNNLILLENRIKTFFAQNTKSMKSQDLIVPKLRRFNVEQENDVVGQPKPGGKVWVRKRLCRYANATVKLSDHEHIRHHMVPELPQFRNVQKSQVILHHLLPGALHINQSSFNIF